MNAFISGSDFATVKDVATWTNQLIGRPIPGSNSIIVKDVVQFQVVPQGALLSVLVMVETERKKSMSSMVINMRKDLGLNEDE